MLPQLGYNTHILFTATPPRCDGATTTLNSPLSTLNSSHTFSAKEKDSETGLSYFGARYYSSDLSIWLSVDPMSDKYPSPSPYVYCADNPVKLVDPNGEEFGDPPPTDGDPPKIIKATESNKSHISKVSWGETSGIYPTSNVDNPSAKDIYNPENWDSDKLTELLKARAAIHLIGNKRNSNVRKSDCGMRGIEKTLASYHLTDNFPDVDDEIANDETVKYFYLSSEERVKTPSINSNNYRQECVKTYGPFYNIGGGDVPKGRVYIHFYKAVPNSSKSKKKG